MIGRMRLDSTCFALLLGSLLLGCASLSGPGGLPLDVRNTRNQYAADLARFDRHLEQYFTEDAVLTHGTRVYRGREAIVKDYLTDSRALAGVTFRTVRVTDAGNEITEEGRWNLQRRSAVALTRNGRYTHVWLRASDGVWRLHSVTLIDDL